MSRVRSPNRDKAFEIYKENFGKITSKDIAALLGESERTVSKWRSIDKWREKYNPDGGAPKGNNNAVGHKGKGKSQNQNHRKAGWYSKLFPKTVFSTMEMLEGLDPIEILWQNIKIKYAQILHAQKVMHVKSKKDITKELKKIKSQKDDIGKKDNTNIVETYREEEYEIQFAWDKEANFLKAQSMAMATLTKMIKDYEELVSKKNTATEEQKLRIEILKQEIKLNDKKLNSDGLNDNTVIKVTLPDDLEND